MRTTIALLFIVFLGLADAAEPNSLTPTEQRDGWVLLFNGRDSTGWRGFDKTNFPTAGWVTSDGWLHHLPGREGGDLVTTRVFPDFELTFEWRISPGGNSGVKYFIDEARHAPIGHEYQLIDDDAHPDAKHGPNRQTAALYDALAPKAGSVKKAGELNVSRIVIQGDHVEHWLNGARVLEYTIGSPELTAAKATSKFKDEAKWGTKFSTPILLQDHGDEVWFRNLKIRELKP